MGFSLVIAAAFIGLALPGTAGAATHWNVGDGNWSDVSKWTNGLPVEGDQAFLDSYGTVTYDNEATPTLSELRISANGLGTSMVLEHSANTLTLSSYLSINGTNGGLAEYHLSGTGTLVKESYEVKIGTDGEGYFYQDGGEFQFSGALYLGDQSNGHGVYDMTGGSIVVGPNGPGGIVLGEWGGLGKFYQSGGTVDIVDLTLARQENSTGNYSLSGDSSVTLTVDGPVVVGHKGNGTFTQEGGIHTVKNNDLTVGYYSGSSGTYNLIDGELNVQGNEYIGRETGSSGIFNQSGGSHTVTQNLYVDAFAGSKGVYNLSSGSLTVDGDRAVVGSFGNGEFNQGPDTIYPYYGGDGGIFKTAGHLILGELEEGTGTYNLYGGILDVGGWTDVGQYGTGVFNQNGGTHTTNGLVLGQSEGSSGYYELNNDGMLSVGGAERIGVSGEGSFKQTNGTHEIGSDLVLANDVGSTGSYDLQGGDLSVTGYTFVGMNGEGSFTQTGGTHQALGLTLGQEADGDGKYDLNDGSLAVGQHEHIGLTGNGTITQGEGSHTIGSDLVLGNETTGNGTFNLKSGTLEVGGNTYVGMNGNGTFDQTGGMHTVSGDITIAANAGSTGTYNFSGGTLTADNIIINSGGLFQGAGVVDASFNIQGGTLAPGSSPGSLTINGSFDQTSGILAIELGGYDQGTDYDFLKILGGDASLAGKLEVSLWEGFLPEVGDTFDILYAKSGINGIFGSYLLPEGWNWDVAYLNLDGLEGLDTVRLTANAVPIPDAIWLLGSGLIGLVGIRRRINK